MLSRFLQDQSYSVVSRIVDMNTKVDVRTRLFLSRDSMTICIIAWDRDETLLNSVDAVIRAASPRRRRRCISSGLDRLYSVKGDAFTRPYCKLSSDGAYVFGRVDFDFLGLWKMRI